MGALYSELSMNQIIAKLKSYGAKLEVPKDYATRLQLVNQLLDNDTTGLVGTTEEFMIGCATVDFNIVTDTSNLTDTLKDWSKNQINRNISDDIPFGLREVSGQYFRERWTSSFIVLKIVWNKIGDLILPSRMFFLDTANIKVVSNSVLGKNIYYLGNEENILKSNKNETIIIRKPYAKWYVDYPTPYLVLKGVLANSMLKQAIVTKQSAILEEIIPYILLLKAGNADLVKAGLMSDMEKKLGDLKDSLKKYKRDHKYRTDEGDSILKARYDVELTHLIPELGKIFDEKILKPIDYNILAGLGLVDLRGFGDTREESIMNPRMLVEEIIDGVLDLTNIYEQVFSLIIEKNVTLHPKHMNKEIRIIPGVIKSILTDAMKKLIKDYSNTGQLSIEDSFEALPEGFDFEVNAMRRKQERDNGNDELFFPRVLLNQDSNTNPDISSSPRQNVSPNEVPQKKKKPVKGEEEYIEAPYKSVDDLPPQVKDVLPTEAQRQWLEVFNSIYERTGGNESRARKGAWSVIKRRFEKDPSSGKWHLKK